MVLLPVAFLGCVTLCPLKEALLPPQPGQAWRITPAFSISRASPCFGLFPPVFAKSGKKCSCSSPGWDGKVVGQGCWFLGSRGPSWPPGLAQSQSVGLPLSLMDRVELNCLFYLSFGACLLPASLGRGRGTKRKREQRGISSAFLPTLSLFTSLLSCFYL